MVGCAAAWLPGDLGIKPVKDAGPASVRVQSLGEWERQTRRVQAITCTDRARASRGPAAQADV
jgi:hypothetical protein